MNKDDRNREHKKLIEKFYTCFAKADAGGMISCYHENIKFQDPAFGPLEAADAKNMWRMLIGRSKGNILIGFSNISAEGNTGKASWVATYHFGKTGRKVVNRISAHFIFEDGKIIAHTDYFDIWKWASQALGLPGVLLGWSPLLKNNIRKKALAQLKAFSNK